MAIVAIVFLIIGLFINRSSNLETSPDVPHISENKIKELGLSKREYEVLTYIAKGLSNKEIADVLCLSENTIKTHVSNVLLKLNAKRRTQAIQIAKTLKIL